MNNRLNVNDVIDWFLANSKTEISPKKLQKLLYYAYGWGLAFFNEPTKRIENKLFDANFEAWVHGPVIRSVYFQNSKYGYSPIPQTEITSPELPEDIEDLLKQILEVYGGYNGNELESLTHQESPWLNARKGLSPIEPSQNIISDKDMFEFFTGELNG